jgi:hypothetical protein
MDNQERMKRMGMPHEAVYVCEHVFAGSHPIAFVSRVGGEWQFLCGGGHENDEIPRVVGLEHIISHDSSVLELYDLPVGWEAERESPYGPWKRCQAPEEAD